MREKEIKYSTISFAFYFSQRHRLFILFLLLSVMFWILSNESTIKKDHVLKMEQRREQLLNNIR